MSTLAELGIIPGFSAVHYQDGTKGSLELCGWPGCENEAYFEQQLVSGRWRGLCPDHVDDLVEAWENVERARKVDSP